MIRDPPEGHVVLEQMTKSGLGGDFRAGSAQGALRCR